MAAPEQAAGVYKRATGPAWTLRVEVDEPDAVLVSALDLAGRPGGFASAGPAREAPGRWELYAIGVDASLRGTGVADALLEAAAACRDCVVWVEADNARARSFYARHGFVPDGAERLHEALGTPEVRLGR